MIWLWSEYFRAIPHLQQSGVLKNFALETEGHFSGQYQAVAKRYYSPDRRVIHPAAPVVGHFNDLAYVSNIDLLLAKDVFSSSEQAKTVDFEQTQRCYQFQLASTSPLAAQQVIANTLNISAIAASEQIAQRLRRVKEGQGAFSQHGAVFSDQPLPATSEQLPDSTGAAASSTGLTAFKPVYAHGPAASAGQFSEYRPHLSRIFPEIQNRPAVTAAPDRG